MNQNKSRIVKILDPKTGALTSIPAAELSPNMIQCSLNGELCWLDPRDMPTNTPLRHPPFKRKLRRDLQRLVNILGEVYPLTLKGWEDGFRRETHPRKEISIWLHLAEIYQDFAIRDQLTSAQKKDLFRILHRCCTCRYEDIPEVMPAVDLSQEFVHEVLQAYYNQPELKAEAARKPAVEYPDPCGNIPRPVENLRDPEERKLLEEAEIIWGVDSYTGNSAAFYGKARLREIIDTGVPTECRTISYLYDSRTDQMELLVAAVEIVKGFHEYTQVGKKS